MSFLNKTNLGNKPGGLGAKKLGGGIGLKKTATPKEVEIEETSEPVVEEKAPTVKPTLGAKKLGGGLGVKKLGAKPKVEKIEEDIQETEVIEEAPVKEELTFEAVEQEQSVKEEKPAKKELKAKTLKATMKDEEEPSLTINEKRDIEVKTDKVEVKETKKKAASKSKAKAKKVEVDEDELLEELAVDESKRVELDQMNEVMRPLVAPTTELWEQEKQDVLDALNNIKVEQDMDMNQVKNCLAELDDLNFEILPKMHDAETMYDGTKQNYDTVKAMAIAKTNASNAEARKAVGMLACKNFTTPNGDVVDLHQYMLLIEERNKFYQKIAAGISFKKYSLVNYNNALKVESKN